MTQQTQDQTTQDQTPTFKTLGVSGATFQGLETFDLPDATRTVAMRSKEVTALCPVTGQPDWYTVTIEITQSKRGIESKSLKLYLQQYREVGILAEQLGAKICRDVAEAVGECVAHVLVRQEPRGGILIVADAFLDTRGHPERGEGGEGGLDDGSV
jgi:7-cyano-7-deazaguanine reductase